MHGEDTKSDVGVLGDDEVLLILSLFEGSDMVDCLHGIWKERGELLFAEVLGDGSDTIDGVLANGNHVDIGPEGDFDELVAELIKHHGVSIIAVVDVGNKEEGSILQFLWSNILIVLKNGAKVELNIIIKDFGDILFVDSHQSSAALIDIDSSTRDFIKIFLNLFNILLINLSLLLFLLNFNEFFTLFS